MAMNIKAGDLPETDEELEQIMEKLDAQQDKKSSKKRSNPVLTATQIAALDAEEERTTTAELETMVAEQHVTKLKGKAVKPAHKSAKKVPVQAPKPTKAPKTPVEPLSVGYWFGRHFTLATILEMHADARSGLDMAALMEKYHLPRGYVKDVLRSAPHLLKRSAAVASANNLSFTYPEPFVVEPVKKVTKPGVVEKNHEALK